MHAGNGIDVILMSEWADSDLSRCFRHDRFTPESGHAGLA